MAVISAVEAGNANVLTFLDLLGWAEGTTTSPATQNDGYDVIVTGHDRKPNVFTDYSEHPFANGREPIVLRVDAEGKPTLESTASGRYQLLLRTWNEYFPKLGVDGFTPEAQDLVACRLIRERGGVAFLASNEIASAIHSCSNIWASLPGNGYGQGGKSMDALLDKFQQLKRGR